MTQEPKKIDPIEGLDPTYVVSGDTTIGECVDLMRSSKMTALIVCDSPYEIDGIFTDRDIFLKIYKDELSKPFWEFPVRVIMSRPVFGLEKDLLHLAAELMADHNIRHIPIIKRQGDKSIQILGLITQDSVFKSQVKSTKSWRNFMKLNPKKMGTAIYTDDRQLLSEIKETFKENKSFIIKDIRKEELSNPSFLRALVESNNSFVIDVDRLELKIMQKLFSELVVSKNVEKIIILSSSDKMTSDFLKNLKILQKSNGFQLVLKPVDGGTFLQLFMSPTEFKK